MASGFSGFSPAPKPSVPVILTKPNTDSRNAPGSNSSPIIDPSAARYAALDAAAKSSSTAAKNIAKAQASQMAAKASPSGMANTLNNFQAQPVAPHGMANTLNNFEALPKPSPVSKPVSSPILTPKTNAGINTGGLPYTPTVTPTPDTVSDNSNTSSSVTFNSDNGGGSSATIPTTAVKVATPDIILVDQESLPVELMTNLIFEDIGGQELLSLSRHDLITGSGLEYQPIKNLNDIAIQYNSQNIIPMPDSSDSYLTNYPIRLDLHVIEEFSSTDASHIRINSSKELEILLTDLKFGEQVEVEVLSSVSIYNSTKFN